MRLKTLRKFLWALAGVAAVALVLLVIWIDNLGDRSQTADEVAHQAVFELTDHQGRTVTQDDFVGQWLLVFFGFANCPDICPSTLAELAVVVSALGEDSATIQPLFISIDPDRDTPAALAEFVPRFEAGIIGLTGTPSQIAQTSKSFYIFYEKIEEASAPDGYTMGHSSQLFLFNPTGSYVKAWQYGTPAEQIVGELTEIVAR